MDENEARVDEVEFVGHERVGTDVVAANLNVWPS